MDAATVSFDEISFASNGSDSFTGGSPRERVSTTLVERGIFITVSSWDITHQRFFKEKVVKRDITLKNSLFLNFKYYPVLSILMMVPALMSATLLWAYWMYDALTINPGVLLWAFIGFGGMYFVLFSAAREIHGAKK